MLRTISSFLTTALLVSGSSSMASVSSYEVTSELCNHGELFALRHFSESGQEKFLVVNTSTLQTKVVAPEALTACVSQSPAGQANSYGSAVDHYNSSPESLSACQGFKSFPVDCLGSSSPMVLTGDLCPSSKSFDQWSHDIQPFLLKLASLKRSGEQAPHLVLAVTGAWLKSHARELAVIKSLDLNITWANHSSTHGLLPTSRLPEEHAFLTQMSLAQFRAEVLGAEQAMLEHGLVPSIFFRFPGLYSKGEQVEELKVLGLVPLNTTAWLALDRGVPPFFKACGMSQDQAAAAGRVILTHANDNEPLGIRKAMLVLGRQNEAENFISIQQAVRCDLTRLNGRSW